VKTYRSTPEVLAEIERVLSPNHSSPGADPPLDAAVRALHEGRHYFSTTIYLTEGESLRLRSGRGPAGCPEVIRLGQGLVGKAAQTGRPQVATAISHDSDYQPHFAETRAEIAQPIRTPGRVLGVINVESAQENALGRQDQVLLKEAASRLGLFLAGRGKYLMHQWNSTGGTSEVKSAPQTAASENSARSAVAGRRTAK
jgi:putative methionine-R-sulfoxide reductase with GAF domain